MLSERPGRVLTYMMIAELVWGSTEGVDKSAIEVHVSRLRRKLGECGETPRFIHTVRGVGYRFQLPQSDAQDSLPLATFLWDDDWELVQVEVADSDVVPIEPREMLGTHFLPPLKAQSSGGEGDIQLAAQLAVGLGISRASGTSSMRLTDGRQVAVNVDCEFFVHESALLGTRMTISTR